jgi:shikimate kinase
MGCGKASVGRLLASRLGCDFVDLDAAVVSETGIGVQEILSLRGEPAFRELESRALARIAARAGSVVCTGAGAVLAQQNRSIMRQAGTVVNLTASVAVIASRLLGDGATPLLEEDLPIELIRNLLAEREPYYADADLRLDTTAKTVEAVVDEIQDALKGSL